VRYTLKDYQADAVADVIDRLDTARTMHRAPRPKQSAFALTATTGAGKTVMAAAVIEALFFGNDELDVEPDPTAVVLWFSDDPSLNEQTRHRLLAASDRLMWDDLVTIEYPFPHEKLAPGKVYFLNTNKLAKGTRLTRGHVGGDDEEQLPELRASVAPDLSGFTIWETIANTINDPDRTLLMVLDEAHRGFGTRTTSDKPTIVRQLINGHAGVPPMPIVWGISATVERFETAMSEAGVTEASRLALPKVLVDPARVQASGLLKDTIRLDIPAEAGTFDTVLLERATEKVINSTRAWAEYATTQATEAAGAGTAEDPVIPLIVLQLPNRPNPEDVARALDTIFARWPDLRGDQVAHVLGDHTAQQYGPFEVRYIAPDRVQDDTSVRVLLAKDGISTGWDCPRAEVLVSFRPAKDATHITQLLGRMVRTPLARRIPGDDQLNAVECILPFFDKKTAKDVVRVITGAIEDFPDSGDGGRKVLIDPQLMVPNSAIPEEVWEAFENLPSQSLPRKTARPVKRLTALAHHAMPTTWPERSRRSTPFAAPPSSARPGRTCGRTPSPPSPTTAPSETPSVRQAGSSPQRSPDPTSTTSPATAATTTCATLTSPSPLSRHFRRLDQSWTALPMSWPASGSTPTGSQSRTSPTSGRRSTTTSAPCRPIRNA